MMTERETIDDESWIIDDHVTNFIPTRNCNIAYAKLGISCKGVAASTEPCACTELQSML